MTIADQLNCSTCGITFGVPQGYLDNRRNDKAVFYCPNGHSMSYHESEADLLRRERDRLKQQQARLEEENAAVRLALDFARDRMQHAEAANKRLKKRSSAGTCPCCSRTFANMAEHMKRQHPAFVADGGAKVVPIKRQMRREDGHG
jgi:septal ring factor EnvC (AmiA/AmiB activator)